MAPGKRAAARVIEGTIDALEVYSRVGHRRHDRRRHKGAVGVILALAPVVLRPGELLHYTEIADRINERSDRHVPPRRVYLVLSASDWFEKVLAGPGRKRRALFRLAGSSGPSD